MPLEVMEEIKLFNGIKNILRRYLDSDNRAAMDPRSQHFDLRVAHRNWKSTIELGAATEGIDLDDDEAIVYRDRCLRQAPDLLDETVTAENMPALED